MYLLRYTTAMHSSCTIYPTCIFWVYICYFLVHKRSFVSSDSWVVLPFLDTSVVLLPLLQHPIDYTHPSKWRIIYIAHCSPYPYKLHQQNPTYSLVQIKHSPQIGRKYVKPPRDLSIAYDWPCTRVLAVFFRGVCLRWCLQPRAGWSTARFSTHLFPGGVEK